MRFLFGVFASLALVSSAQAQFVFNCPGQELTGGFQLGTDVTFPQVSDDCMVNPCVGNIQAMADWSLAQAPTLEDSTQDKFSLSEVDPPGPGVAEALATSYLNGLAFGNPNLVKIQFDTATRFFLSATEDGPCNPPPPLDKTVFSASGDAYMSGNSKIPFNIVGKQQVKAKLFLGRSFAPFAINSIPSNFVIKARYKLLNSNNQSAIDSGWLERSSANNDVEYIFWVLPKKDLGAGKYTLEVDWIISLDDSVTASCTNSPSIMPNNDLFVSGCLEIIQPGVGNGN